VIGVPRGWCVGQSGANGVVLRRGVWRTALCAIEVREWIDSIERIERRHEQTNRWVDWSKCNLSPEGARAVSHFGGYGAPLRFWRRCRQDAGSLRIDGELYERGDLEGVMVFHADRPDWWIPLLNS
jgi:hypothetical protein